MKKPTILIIASTTVLVACGIYRYESIETCEFETRAILGTKFFSSTNCLGNKDEKSHLRETVENTIEVTKGE